MKFYINILGLLTFFSCGHTMLGEEYARKALYDALADTVEVRYTFAEGNPVRDKETATKLAEPLLFEIFGESTIKDERPYEIYNIDGHWIIMGTLPRGDDGGTFEIIFESENRKIIRLTHYR